MFLEKRPTCVTVIGWVWVVLGWGSCINGAVIIYIMSNSIELRDLLGHWAFLPFAQMALGALATVAGHSFLRLKAWSRPVLEILTWLLILWIIGFTAFMFVWVASHDSGMNNLLLPALCAAFYGIPLGVMVKTLRGERVRSAIAGVDDQAPS